ncbi:hypothetical protein FHL15_010365 [Xylaria flabelliformis]|uniref:Uncharacterized protein n=1 Tax=Xylaria flabelliformis TaxID=2512241 RepID=A0A553HLF9_9PEZI|nr:hypothetical protein FHL15_010365 [Xylaria flabelliformis]
MAQLGQVVPTATVGQSVIKFPEYPDFQPTVDVPWITDGQRQTLQALHKMPLQFIARMIVKRAECALLPSHPPDSWINATIANKILKDTDQLEMLIHSIPRKHIRAIVMGTIGWHIAPERGASAEALRGNPYKRNGPGTYIATITIDGRGGRGLSGIEYQTLAEKVEDYLEARDASQVQAQLQTRRMKDLLKWANRIDRFFAHKRASLGTTVLVSTDRAYEKMRDLVKVFRSRHASTIQLDPNAHPIQGMSYVGCAIKDIRDRSASHHHHSTYEQSNYTWWLTMSCIKDMGLLPFVRISHAIRTWEPEQLPLSEILVTVLAQSMIEECGFNAWLPGGTVDSLAPHRNWDGDLIDVMHYRTYLPDQLRETADLLEDFTKKLVSIDELSAGLRRRREDLLLKVWETESMTSLKFTDEDDIRKTMSLRSKLIDETKLADEQLETCMQFFAEMTSRSRKTR